MKNKYTKMHFKYMYLMPGILQIHLHIYVLNKKYPAIVLLEYQTGIFKFCYVETKKFVLNAF